MTMSENPWGLTDRQIEESTTDTGENAKLQAVFDNRKVLHFTNDPSEGIGRVVGPTYNNEYLVMTEAHFEAKTGQWTAFYRYATPADMLQEAATLAIERLGRKA
jgi:hypothetical protein